MQYSFSPFVRFVAKSAYLIENKKIVACDARLIYVISGNAVFECDGKKYELKQGTLLFYPYGTPYGFYENHGLLFYTLNFDFTNEYSSISTMRPVPVASHNPSAVLHTAQVTDCELFFAPIVINDAIWAAKDIEIIYSEGLKKESGYAEMQALSLKRILINIFRLVSEQKNNPICNKIKRLVQDNPGTKITEIAEIINYHPFYLNEVFKKHEGISLHKYIMRERLMLSYELLTASKLTLSEIADKCGFSSQAHFSAAFKSMYGTTAGKIRNQT